MAVISWIVRRAVFVVSLVAIVGSASAADTLRDIVATARTEPLAPQQNPPKWLNWDKVQGGLQFEQKHARAINLTLGTSSLVSTYACRDITPVVMQTGRLPHDYQRRMIETAFRIYQMLAMSKDEAAFDKQNYPLAYSLGLLHQDIGKRIAPADLGWNPKERAVMSQQAVAFVLYSFAWQPIEELEATHEIDPVKDAKAIDDWLNLWCVLGYAMGVEEPLLPKDEARGRAVIAELRRAQYPKRGEEPPQGMTVLLHNEVLFLENVMPQGATPQQKQANAIKRLTDAILVSPGLPDALRLGAHPEDSLTKLMASG